MRFRILGPLHIRATPVTASRDRVVLGMLLLDANRMVPIDRLVDALWEDRPPATARNQVQDCVSRLRRTLSGAGIPAGSLVTDPSGYRLRVLSDDVDADVFTRTIEQAREVAADDPEKARELFQVGLDLWRGPVLAGVTSPAVRLRAAGLAEQQATAIEDLLDVELRLGRDRTVLGTLAGLIEQYPLRERLRAQLMLALYRADRRADALAEYRRTRAVLRDELGIEPGPVLQEVHRQILAGDVPIPGAAPPKPDVPAGGAGFLPRPVPDFTGRQEAVRRLVAAAQEMAPGGPMVRVIDGMAGSGKTTLAVHLASRLTSRYPDAQLFVDLRGHSTSGPMEPAAALLTLLRQLDVPAGRIPPEMEHRIALWYRELATRRAVIVLDNAGSSEQIRPLVPPASDSLVLVTSRRRLLGFDGMPPESLPALTPAEAVELLARVAGRGRVAAEPDAAATVVRRCGYLPLAIRLAGARLAHRPGWQIADLANRLDADHPVLAELSVEDRTVVGAFTLSYEPLPEPARRTFRLLGHYPGEFLQAATVAALTGLTLPDAESVLSQLVDHHLVEEPTAGRFRLHDLMRQYAHDLTTTTDTPAERQTAIEHLLDHYLHAVAAAATSLKLSTLRDDVNLGPPLRPDLASAVVSAPSTWLEAERTNIRALVRFAVAAGNYRPAWQLARLSWRFLYTRCYFDDILDTHGQGLLAAERDADDTAAAVMHNYIAAAYVRTSDSQTAVRHLERAIEIRDRLGDVTGSNLSRSNLAVAYCTLGRLQEADALYEPLLRERRRYGINPLPLITNIGWLLTVLGRYDEALRLHRLQLMASWELDDLSNVGQALANIGSVQLRRGQHAYAIRLITAALRVKRRAGDHHAAAESINELGVALRRLGRLAEAERQHRSALAVAADVGERHAVAAVLNDLGQTVDAAGRRDEAVELHRQALRLATRIHHPYEQGRALTAIADHLDRADPVEARRHRERALVIFRRMGVPERLDVERRLAEFTAG